MSGKSSALLITNGRQTNNKYNKQKPTKTQISANITKTQTDRQTNKSPDVHQIFCPADRQ